MAERNAPVDPAVDELKRRARRRLVGAIVLALAAAVLLPMLLEKEPRPLGEDVTVKIPAVDDGKFVSRLATPDATKVAVAASPAASAPADSAGAPVASPAGATTAPAPAAPGTQASAFPTGSRASVSEAEQRVLAAGATSASGKGEPTRETRAAASATKEKPAERPHEPRPAAKGGGSREPAKAASADGFVVQLAAFSDDKGANALASKLKRQGYHAYTEAVQTSRGTLYRVRVGGYASREAAGEARNKLKGEGYSGIVAPAH